MKLSAQNGAWQLINAIYVLQKTEMESLTPRNKNGDTYVKAKWKQSTQAHKGNNLTS